MRSTRTRVCMLIPGYNPVLDRSGSQLSGLLDRINRDRVAPFVLTRRFPGADKAEMAGATPVIRRRAPLGSGMFFLSALFYLWIRRREYDVIHVHTIDSTALAGAMIKRLLPDKKLVQRIPHAGPESLFDRMSRSRSGRRRLQYLLDKADTIIPACSDTPRALADLGIPTSKIDDIPDGIDAGQFAPPTQEEKRVLKRSFGIAENAFVAIAVARLFPRANVDGVLEAWKKVQASHPGAVLVVAGGGPEGPRLARLAESEFEGRSVIFTGTASEEEILRLYRTADAFVSYEKSQRSLDTMLEAMSSGLPVVAPRGPGAEARVRHMRTGFLFDADHPADGADYLTRLAEDPSLLGTMSAAARGALVDEYSFESIARRIEGVYAGIPASRVPRVPKPEKPAPVTPVEPPAATVTEAPGPEKPTLVAVAEPPATAVAEAPKPCKPEPVAPVEPPATVVAEAPTPEPAPVAPVEPPKTVVAVAPAPEPPPVDPAEAPVDEPTENLIPAGDREVAEQPPATATGKRRRQKKRRNKKKRNKTTV